MQLLALRYPSQAMRDARRSIAGASYAQVLRNGALLYGALYAGRESPDAMGSEPLGHHVAGWRLGGQYPLTRRFGVFAALEESAVTMVLQIHSLRCSGETGSAAWPWSLSWVPAPSGASRRNWRGFKMIPACRSASTRAGSFPLRCVVSSEMTQARLTEPSSGSAMKHDYRFPPWSGVNLATGWPLAAMAAAGLVLLRQASAGAPWRVFSALARGASVDGGDVILTGGTGRAQIRFTDGGLVSLSPQSEFTVTRYVDEW